jgi:hypothetical protein
MGTEWNAANRDARWASLGLVALCLLILAGRLLILAGLAAFGAFGQEPVPSPTPTMLSEISQPPPAWIKWLDRTLVPGINWFGKNPVAFALLLLIAAYFLYLCIAVPIVWTIKSKYNGDRAACSFRVLLVWNLLEFTALSPWIMLGRTTRHYWPVKFKPWEPDTVDGRIPAPDALPKDDG